MPRVHYEMVDEDCSLDDYVNEKFWELVLFNVICIVMLVVAVCEHISYNFNYLVELDIVIAIKKTCHFQIRSTWAKNSCIVTCTSSTYNSHKHTHYLRDLPFQDVLQCALDRLRSPKMEVFITIAWMIWNTRNDVWLGKMPTPAEQIGRAGSIILGA